MTIVFSELDESWQAPAETALPSCQSKTPHLLPIRRWPCPSFPLAIAWLNRIWDRVEGGGHWATKTNINTGFWGSAGQDSRAGILIGVTDRSHNKPYTVFLRSHCLPLGVNNQEALCSVSVNLCFISPFVLPLIHPCLCSSGPSWSNWTRRQQRTQRLTGESKNLYLWLCQCRFSSPRWSVPNQSHVLLLDDDDGLQKSPTFVIILPSQFKN